MKKVLGIWIALMCVFVMEAVAQTPGGNRFYGVVTTPNGMSEERVEGATITLQPGGYTDMTDANGEFSISNVPSGTYQVTIAAPGCNGYQQDLQINTDKRVVFSLECAMEQPAGQYTFSGKVTTEPPSGPQDQPVAGATVRINELNLQTTTDAQGLFNFGMVPMGNYTVTASAPGQGSINMDLQLNENKYVVLGLPGPTPGIDQPGQ